MGHSAEVEKYGQHAVRRIRRSHSAQWTERIESNAPGPHRPGLPGPLEVQTPSPSVTPKGPLLDQCEQQIGKHEPAEKIWRDKMDESHHVCGNAWGFHTFAARLEFLVDNIY